MMNEDESLGVLLQLQIDRSRGVGRLLGTGLVVTTDQGGNRRFGFKIGAQNSELNRLTANCNRECAC